jgi:O-antigen ligase
MFFSEVISYGIFFELIDPIGKSSIKNPTPFMHHTSYSVFLAITSIILLNRILITDDYKLKFLFFLFFLSVTTNLFINSGRTGQIAFILTLFIVLFYVVRLNVKNVLLLSFSVFSIALTAYNFSPNFNDRMNETKNDIEKVVIHSKYNSNLGVRAGFWIISREILKESPVLGVGVSSHIDYLNRKARSNFSHLKASGRFEHFHSQYLNIFAQLGILGLLIYGYFLFSIANIKVLNQEVNVFKIGLMSVFLLGFFVDTLLRFNIDIMLFSFMLGVVLAQNKFESNA